MKKYVSIKKSIRLTLVKLGQFIEENMKMKYFMKQYFKYHVVVYYQ